MCAVAEGQWRWPGRTGTVEVWTLMCQRCPVLVQCRSHALDIAEPFGVWAGLSEGQRQYLLGVNSR